MTKEEFLQIGILIFFILFWWINSRLKRSRYARKYREMKGEDFAKGFKKVLGNSSGTQLNLKGKLKELNELKAEGLITEEEYNQKRKELISKY